MTSRKQFFHTSGLGLLSSLIFPLTAHSEDVADFEGLVVSDEEGDAYQLRDGKAVVKIKIAKQQGSQTISFLASSLPPGDVILVHKHLNEDEIFFLHKGSGLFTLGEKRYPIKTGAVIIAPRGVWHGLENTGTENIELRFGYTPSGAEGFFREVGVPVGQPFVQKSMEERRSIAKKWGILYKN
jgi:quercetin dioxygenase-like cupin family protein